MSGAGHLSGEHCSAIQFLPAPREIPSRAGWKINLFSNKVLECCWSVHSGSVRTNFFMRYLIKINVTVKNLCSKINRIYFITVIFNPVLFRSFYFIFHPTENLNVLKKKREVCSMLKSLQKMLSITFIYTIIRLPR